MFIDVRIPWEPGKRLGYAFNRTMQTVEGWVLVLDWDVTLLNINWYDICIDAIKRYGSDAGLFSCVTNRIGCPLQKNGMSNTDDILMHVACSEMIENEHKGMVTDVTDSQHKLSGMFFLTHKDVYNQIGPAPDDKFIGFDNWYHDRVKEIRKKIYIIESLYVYHRYKRQWKQ